jgi:hypothetical protein
MSKFSDATLYLAPSGYKEGILFPQKPLSTNGEISFTRTSSAWRTNIEGQVEETCYNLLQQSEDFTNPIWTQQSIAITTNTTTAPNGTLTADTLAGDGVLNQKILYQNTNINSGTTYSLSCYIKKNTNNFAQVVGGSGAFGLNVWANFDLNSGVVGSVGSLTTASITNVGDGWYRCTIIGTATATVSSVALVLALVNSSTATRAESNSLSTSVFIWGAQLVQGSLPRPYLSTTNKQNFPRVDYSLGTGTFLLEPQRTNLFFNSGWTGGGGAPTNWNSFITGTTTAVTSIKNSGVTAYRFSGATQRAFFISGLSVTNGVTYAMSVYVESVTITGDVGFMLSFANITGTATYFRNGVSITASTTVEAGYTYTMLFVPSVTGAGDFRIGMGCQGNAIADYVLSMPQFEQGAYSSSFILTPSAATATRIADSFSRGNIFTNNLISSSGGTWFVELKNNVAMVRDVVSEGLFIDTANGGFGNGFTLRHGGGGANRLNITKVISGVLTILHLTTTDIVKVAIKWNGTTADVFVNGTKQVSATAFTTTNMEFLATPTTQDVPKFIQQMALWRTPLTDAQCQELTL